ncbi:DNA-dependent ATPase [Saccharomycopsis crataegensis]|uniref:DNA helicase n=1 Tax=Saccharomycopsis crataegensis TaxID=43959 RepID=A0AAV5QHY1_9ASCO|nr:DNA-dependent ATPase [Saccharomycopsis crataegensis]
MFRNNGKASSGINKPFKPPRMVRPGSNGASSLGITKPSSQTTPSTILQRDSKKMTSSTATSFKKPRLIKPETNPSAGQDNVNLNVDTSMSRYFMVVYRKKTMKKNKTWNGDGVLIVKHCHLSLKYDKSGIGKSYTSLASAMKKNINLEEIISIDQYEVEVDYEVVKPQELTQLLGKLSSSTNHNQLVTEDDAINVVVAVAPAPEITTKSRPYKSVMMANDRKSKEVGRIQTKGLIHNRQSMRKPLFTIREDSLVLDKVLEEPDKVIDVIVDPLLCNHLRPHQKQGVKFLYNCVMGITGSDISGALLADEMGLGKTLMTITLIWTLLRQSPYLSQSVIAKKVLVVVPVTLIGNWKKEFKKWLNVNRIAVLTLGSSKNNNNEMMSLRMFGQTKVHQVLLIGYEKLVTVKDVLVQSRIKFDLLVCDEGHRLKSGSSKAIQVLKSLNIKRKVLLSGTPIQNDLEEFYTLIDFINPGILGSYPTFQKEYMKPILRSREPNCTNQEILRIGHEKSQQLILITKPFILRRTNEILNKFLPPRQDLVIFIKPTSYQTKVFGNIIRSKNFECFEDNVSDGVASKTMQAESFAMINLFKKVCNSPSLIKDDNMFNKLISRESNSWWQAALVTVASTSGKLWFLMELLKEISFTTHEKVVVISNYTKTLDLIETLIRGCNNMSFSRLDGSTAANKRDAIINGFNNSSHATNFIFLLSAKSGGAGLNLVGASRLVLVDNDWNPSIDLQAMARIHRDGQKRPCYVYRLITTGCIDEKIFQRQLMKISLSDKFLDDKNNSKDDIFDYQDLKELFKLDLQTQCNTHDLIECPCEGTGEVLSFDEEEKEGEEEKEEKEMDYSQDKGENLGWVSAKSMRSMQESMEEDRMIEKSRKIRGCLNDFSHCDPKFIKNGELESTGDTITDTILKNIDTANRISYILTKTSS